VAIIFSMLLSVTVFGILGVVVAVPLAAIARILHEELYRPRYLPNVAHDNLDQMASSFSKGRRFLVFSEADFRAHSQGVSDVSAHSHSADDIVNEVTVQMIFQKR